MVTFNVDSLDFVDDEEARFGADTDFATRFDSANSRLELEDLTAGTVAHVPTGTATDLVGGKYAQTVAEGKALADDGNVYDSIQEAVNNASSYVKVGPGEFRESVTIDTAGLTLQGSGERTLFLSDETDTIKANADDITLKHFTIGNKEYRQLKGKGTGVNVFNVTINNGRIIANDGGYLPEWSVIGCSISSHGNYGITLGSKSTVVQNTITDVAHAIYIDGNDSIVAFNNVRNVVGRALWAYSQGDDSIFYGNHVKDVDGDAIYILADDCIFVNNLLVNASGIDNRGSGNVVQDNKTIQT